jgi:hypothetical protein
MSYIELAIDAWFLLDVAMNFFTGYHEFTGEYVDSLPRIARRYFRGWFALDLISSIPADFIAELGAASNDVTTLRLVRLLRMARLLKLFRLTRLRRFFARVSALSLRLPLILLYLVVAHASSSLM